MEKFIKPHNFKINFEVLKNSMFFIFFFLFIFFYFLQRASPFTYSLIELKY